MEQAEESKPVSRPQPVVTGIVAGAISGLVARFAVFPADTLKARLQVQGALDKTVLGPRQLAASLFRAEGIPGFYRGFGAVVLGAVPAQAAYFGGIELGRSVTPREWGIGRDMATGCIAQVIAGVAFTPVDIIKERLQVQTMVRDQRLGYKSAWSAIYAIARSAGVMGFFRGYWATNCVWLPWNVAYVSLYEGLKRVQGAAAPAASDGRFRPVVTSGCAFLAAAGAAVLTHPPDVIKTRLQVLSATSDGRVGWWSTLKSLLHREGPRALWHGLGARVLSVAPGAAVTWALYEEIKGVLETRARAP